MMDDKLGDSACRDSDFVTSRIVTPSSICFHSVIFYRTRNQGHFLEASLVRYPFFHLRDVTNGGGSGIRGKRRTTAATTTTRKEALAPLG